MLIRGRGIGVERPKTMASSFFLSATEAYPTDGSGDSTMLVLPVTDTILSPAHLEKSSILSKQSKINPIATQQIFLGTTPGQDLLETAGFFMLGGPHATWRGVFLLAIWSH